MQRVIDFLNDSGLQYFATIGLDGRPKVRPFQMMFSDGGRLIYCTGAHKAVYQELQVNPDIELCVSGMDRWLRIQGTVCWLEQRELRQRILDHSDLVRSIYHSADNPDLKTFYLQDATAVFKDFSVNEPLVIRLTD